tara:strand:+ start:144 stop:701 length:558 start_codon:yes stop_codon:yes gene_type:complete
MGIFDSLFPKKEIDHGKISSSILGTIAIAEGMVVMHETLKNVKIKRDLRYDKILLAYLDGLVDLYNTAFGVKKILEEDDLEKHHIDMRTYCVIQHYLQKLEDGERKVSEFNSNELEELQKKHAKKLNEKLDIFNKWSFDGHYQNISDRGYEFGKFFYQNKGDIVGTKYAFDLAKILDDEKIQFKN